MTPAPWFPLEPRLNAGEANVPTMKGIRFSDPDSLLNRLGDVVEEPGTDSFDGVDCLENKIYSHLPRGALGLPGQNEGDA